MTSGLRDPGLGFDKHGLPYSADYGDHYFARQNGLAESRYVFLHGNDLPQRWQTRKQFNIGETGFGTGLNLLVTWQYWEQEPGLCQRLHYVSVEKHPLDRVQVRQALALWPELKPYAQRLLAVYPELVPGFHRLHLDQGLTLTLLFGDVLDMLEQLQARIDAWYLDGFAPARNPAMWQPEVLRLIAQHSAPGATLSTFTVAGTVRRGLLEAGLAVEKHPGFGTKREMLRAVLPHPPPRPALSKPWLALPEPVSGERRASIIGAGLAGSAMAYALARRGWQVTVVERESGPARQASGNPAGLLMPRLSAVFEPGNEFYLHGFLYLLRELKHLGLDWQSCGAVQCAVGAEDRTRLERALQAYRVPDTVAQLLDAAEISQRAGVKIPQDGIWFPGGGYIQPRRLCQAWLAQNGIETRFGTEAPDLKYMAGLNSAPVLILAGGLASAQFEAVNWLPLRAYRGQTSALQATARSQGLRVVLCGPLYITPPMDNEHIVGATFQVYDRDSTLRPEDNQANLQSARQWLPDLVTADAAVRSLFAQVRAVTPGRFPAAGPAPDAALFDTHYAEPLRHGKPARFFPPMRHQPGLYLLTGLGSHGMISAPLAAEYLASLLSGEPLPLPRRVIDALNPVRFLVQRAKQS